MMDPLSYFQPGLHDWFNKGHSMYYPVCGMVHIKESVGVAHVLAAGFLSYFFATWMVLYSMSTAM